MPELKPISREAVPLCLDKADRYRLLNDPAQAESICLDVLAVEPDNQRALVVLLLALTDQFPAGAADRVAEAEAIAGRLDGEYERLYYAGIVSERRAVARLAHGGLGSAAAAHAWIEKALRLFEQAERVRPADNADALLRWNSCVRLLQRHHLKPDDADRPPGPVGDD